MSKNKHQETLAEFQGKRFVNTDQNINSYIN